MQNEPLEVSYIALDDLREAPWNPRHITPPELEKLKRSLREFGAVDPAVVNRGDAWPEGKMLVIGGHQRTLAAREEGWSTFPCVFIDVPDEAHAKALNIALNRISGDWVQDQLAELLSELRADEGIDDALAGFDKGETEALIASLEPGGDASGEFDRPGGETNRKCPRCSYEWTESER